MSTQGKYEKLNRIINESKKTVFFGGAGVSTESGIPDFRSKDGLYNVRDVQFEQYEPEYLLSIDCLERDTDVFFEFYRQKLVTSGIQPNRAHYKLAELEKAGKLAGIITQNIDGLHSAQDRSTLPRSTARPSKTTACAAASASRRTTSSRAPRPSPTATNAAT